MKKKFLPLFCILAIAVIILDQLLKQLVHEYMPQIDLGIVSFHFVKNTGAGFGILQNQALLLGFLSTLVAVFIILYYPKIEQQKIPQFFWALFLGGTIGNALDRLVRRFVIDFIDFSFWPAFNLADAAITIAVFGLVIYYWNK